MNKKNERLADLVRAKTGLKVDASDLCDLKGTGLNHDHVVLGRTGWLARIPRGNSPLDSQAYLERQQAVYRAAAPSGHTPELLATLAPTEDLPHGALVVRRIDHVRKADFGRDYAAIAKSLAAIHAVPSPSGLEGPGAPGESQRGYIEAMLVPSLDKAGLDATSRAMLAVALAQGYDDLDRMARISALPVGFIASDTHPGNFLIDRRGKAWMVDLEYAAVDCPLVDAAIAVCPLTRRFDPDSRPAPDGTGEKFFAAWLEDFGRDRSPAARRALGDTRPAMQRVALLGSLGWLAFWQAEGQATMADVPGPTARNWDRLADICLKPDTLGSILRRNGFDAAPALKHFLPGRPAAGRTSELR